MWLYKTALNGDGMRNDALIKCYNWIDLLSNRKHTVTNSTHLSTAHLSSKKNRPETTMPKKISFLGEVEVIDLGDQQNP